MDLPPSGWYPDPYGVPELLRWWDGSTWTHHTHADVAASADVAAGTVQHTTVQPTTVQSATVQAAGQLTAAPPAAGTVATTVPQPALLETAGTHATPVQPATVQPTTVQPTTVQLAGRQGTVLPTTVQPLAMQGGALLGGAMRGGPMPGGGAGRGPDANGTQVLFGDGAWSGPGAPAVPGGPPRGDLYGYQRVQRRRRMWVASGLAGGTVVALGVIALVVNALGQSSAAPAATQSPLAPTAPVAAATSVSPSPSATATGSASTLTDGQTGLSYAQLAAPWGPTCPGGLNNSGFTWTAGESAVAGQVNGGQTTWYGAACSGPLPQQYGYNGVADLANVATNLANQFNSTNYSALNHTYQQEVSQPVQVSGHAGWEIKFLISYAQGQGLTWTDELAAVVVADSGTGGPPAVFYVSIPGNLGENNVDSLVSSLQLSVTPQAAASASASASASDTTAAAAGNGNGNGGPGNGP